MLCVRIIQLWKKDGLGLRASNGQQYPLLEQGSEQYDKVVLTREFDYGSEVLHARKRTSSKRVSGMIQ